MHLRRALLFNAWIQLALVIAIVALGNAWSARRFVRVDLTTDKRYSLDLVTRSLMYQLDKPLYVKVYFTGDLKPPYNNNEQIVVDKLEEMRAYSRGLLELSVTDPTNIRALEEEARRFGIVSMQQGYRDASGSELKKVFMGVALVYGDRQEVLPAVTQTSTLEYELARAVQRLLSDEPPATVGYVVGHGEPDLLTAGGPVEALRGKLRDEYQLVSVTLDGKEGVPEEVDALFVIGPQRPLSDRALYHLDQYLMKGGALAAFLTNVKPDLRTMRAQSIYHGMEGLLGHYGVQVNRDVIVDRKSSGQMDFPVRQGRTIRQTRVNYPLIPRASRLSEDSLVVKDLDSMLFPFVSSLTLADPLPPEVQAEVLAWSGEGSTRLRGLRRVDPTSFQVMAPGEEPGSYALLVNLTGRWDSYFADQPIPRPDLAAVEGAVLPDDPGSKLRQGAEARLVVSGSADFVANNIPFMLNQVDWMLQDESLISIRSKNTPLPKLEPLEPAEARTAKLANLLGGPALILLLGGIRWLIRRRTEA
ncbi:MAG: ABC-2 type transport system permease protein [Myxococcota bacterium]|jgi:ABC-2 type transport system permease protein